MEAPKSDITFTFEHLGHTGRVRVTVRAGSQVFADEFKVTSAKGRERFAAKVCERFGALEIADVLQELERILVENLSHNERETSTQTDQESVSGDLKELDVLVGLVENGDFARLFHTPGQHDAQGFVTFSIGLTRQTWAVDSKAVRFWLLQEFRKQRGKIPSKHVLEEAIFAIGAIAMQSDNVCDVHLRVAPCEGAIYVDLGDDSWRAVRVSPAGWEIVPSAEVPVRFLRRRGMKALAIPVVGGSLDEFFRFVNVPRREDQCLLLSCLLAYLRPRGPYPILGVHGEQGSAKTTTCRRSRDIVDPSSVSARRLPRDEHDLMIAASNSRVQSFDNISTISQAMSDALSSLATGAGLGTRLLYADDEEALFSVCRPVILNGIPDLASRADLLDRSVILHLPPISESQRKDEETQDAEFAEARSRIFGALLTALSKTLRRHPEVRPPSVPRMADFARWGIAAEQALGFPDGFFLRAYRANRSDQIEAALEASPLTTCVLELMKSVIVWEGAAEELLSELNHIRLERDRDTPPRSWPKIPSQLVGGLRRLAPLLRAKGLELETGLREAGGNRDRYLRISKVLEDTRVLPSKFSEPSVSRQGEGPHRDAKEMVSKEPTEVPAPECVENLPEERDVRSPETTLRGRAEDAAGELFDSREFDDV